MRIATKIIFLNKTAVYYKIRHFSNEIAVATVGQQ